MMTPQAHVALTILFGLVALLSAYLSAWAQFRSRVPGAREFSYLMLCNAIYGIGSSIEISRSTLPELLLIVRWEYLGISFIPACVLLFVLHYIREKPASPPEVAAALAIPLITLILIMTVEQHSLFYQSPRMINGAFFPVLIFERGPWYYVNWAYIQGSMIFSLILLIRHALRVGAKKRKQVYGMIAGLSIPLLNGILYFFGMIPGQFDSHPFAIGLSGLVAAVTMFRWGLFELVPAARELALDSIQDGFVVADRNGRLQDLNHAAARLLGVNRWQLGMPLPAINPLTAELQPLLSGTKTQIEFSDSTTQPEPRFYQARAYPIQTRTPRQEGIAILIHDISETTGLLRQLNDQANTDSLTGLLNRRRLIQLGALELEHSLQQGTSLGVIMIDLDHFKQVNDIHGHAAGDIVLRSVSLCCSKALRGNDILGRYGGEEFVALLPNTGIEHTILIAERIRQRLHTWPIELEAGVLYMTASIGVYAAPVWDGATLDEFLNIADHALYQAKSAGRDQVCRGMPMHHER